MTTTALYQLARDAGFDCRLDRVQGVVLYKHLIDGTCIETPLRDAEHLADRIRTRDHELQILRSRASWLA